MKLLPKFAILSFGVSAVPLAVAGLSSLRMSRDALRASITEQERLVAENVRGFVATHLGHLMDVLQIETRVLGRTRPSAEVLTKFLQLVYHQSDDFSAVVALAEDGTPLAPAAFQQRPRPNSALAGHEGVRPEDLPTMFRQVPLGEALRDGAALGPVFTLGPRGAAHTVVAVKYDPLPGEAPTVVAALVSLRRLADHVARLSTGAREVFLLDREGRVVAAGRALGPPALEPKPLPSLAGGPLPEGEHALTYVSRGRPVIAAYARVDTFPFGVIVERLEGDALSPLRRLGWVTIYWMGVSGLVAAVIWAALARSLSTRAGALADGARKIAQGKLDTQLAVRSSDELGELAKAFNAMATSLQAARTEIMRQTDEITAWNETLERRVDEKTEELRQAQDLLLRSRSLAAIGSLGAGVAHEINNPLTAILGMSQLLLADLPGGHPARPMVEDVEEQAQRIQSIVSNLLRLSQRQAGENFRPVDLSKVVNDALELCGPKLFADAGITIEKRVVSPSPPIRGNALQLQAAIMQLIQNARGAMETPGGAGRLVLETSLPEDKLLRLRISDTGRGIDPEHLPRIFDPFFTTKSKRTDTGIGLSVVHKIIEDHGGSIRVESQPGQGTTFWLTFPVGAAASHLA